MRRQGITGLQIFAPHPVCPVEQAKEDPLNSGTWPELLDITSREMEAMGISMGIVKTCSVSARNWAGSRIWALLTVEEGRDCRGKATFCRFVPGWGAL